MKIDIPYSREQKHVSISDTPMLLIEINSSEWPKVCFSLQAETETETGKTSGLRPNTETETESTNIRKNRRNFAKVQCI